MCEHYSNSFQTFELPSLKLTANAPENGWLEYDRFLLGQKADLEGRTVDGRGLGRLHFVGLGVFKKQKLYCEAPYCLGCPPSQDAIVAKVPGLVRDP